jgi:hypothetical protein
VAALCKIMLFHFCFDAQRHIFNSYPQPWLHTTESQWWVI